MSRRPLEPLTEEERAHLRDHLRALSSDPETLAELTHCVPGAPSGSLAELVAECLFDALVHLDRTTEGIPAALLRPVRSARPARNAQPDDAGVRNPHPERPDLDPVTCDDATDPERQGSGTPAVFRAVPEQRSGPPVVAPRQPLADHAL